MTITRNTPLGALALAVLLAVTACADDTEAPIEDLDPAPQTAPESAPASEMIHHTISLDAMNESGVAGEAMAMHSDDAVVIMLEIEGLPGEGEYPAHIHSGNCADGGPVAVPLDPVIGLPDGTGASTTTLEIDEVSEDEPHFIMVHGEGTNPIACGDMEGHGP